MKRCILCLICTVMILLSACVPAVPEALTASGILSNPNAMPEAQALYQYLCESYGNQILSGQQESYWMDTPEYEMDYILETTGKLPAIRGLDYITENHFEMNERAIAWWEQGGIVSICWHWGTPPDGVGYESSLGEVDMEEALTPGTKLNQAMLEQMDAVAQALLELQELGIPVLWRPLHEFDGKWFWWGKGGADAFMQLWQLMYDRFTDVHGLNNLIWVLGYSHRTQSGWYPGDAYVDVAGADYYGKGTQNRRFRKVLSYSGANKPVCYHECGQIPAPDELIADGTGWVWFLTWHTTHIMEENTPEHLAYVYNHDYVATLEDLPDFQALAQAYRNA